MPSLKLPNPFRRPADRPTLRERAATLKAGLARLARRRPQEEADQGRRAVMGGALAAAVPLPALAAPAIARNHHPDQALLDAGKALDTAREAQRAAEDAYRVANHATYQVLATRPAALLPLTREYRKFSTWPVRPEWRDVKFRWVPSGDEAPAPDQWSTVVWTGAGLRHVIERAVPVLGRGGQGTRTATGVFRSGPRERREFCEGYWEKEQTDSLRSCLSEPDATITAKANCEAREVAFNGRRYGLFERPRDAAPDIHTDEHRQMIYRDLKSGEWLDGSTVSGEVTVRTALNALCPGVDPEASYGLVYRDPAARYPRELWGRWFSDPLACADPSRNQADYDEYVWVTITERTERSRDGEDTLSSIRQVGRDTWLIDSTSPSQEETPNFSSVLYTVTRNGLETRSGDAKNGTGATRWVRCSR